MTMTDPAANGPLVSSDEKGIPGGIGTLDGRGKQPDSQRNPGLLETALVGGIAAVARIKAMFERVRTIEQYYQIGDTPNQTWRRAMVAISAEGGGTLNPCLTDYYFTGNAPIVNGLTNVTIKPLHGRTVTIHAAAGAGARTAFSFNSGGDSKNVTFEGLTFDGGMTNFDTITGFARQGDVGTQARLFAADRIERAFSITSSRMPAQAAASRMTNLTIRRCRFLGVGQELLPIDILGTYGDTIVEDCELIRCLDTGFRGVETPIFRRNRVSYSADNGVSISRGCGSGRVHDNTIEYSWYNAILAGGFDNELGAQHVLVYGNKLYQSGKNAVCMDFGARYITVEMNDVDGVFRGAADHTNDVKWGNAFYIEGLDDANWAGHIVIQNNNIQNVRGRVVNLYQYVEAVTFTNNHIGDYGWPFLVDGTTVTPSADGVYSALITYPGAAKTTPTVRNIVNRNNHVVTSQTQVTGGNTIPVARRISWYPNVTSWIDAAIDIQGVGVNLAHTNTLTAVANFGFANIGAGDRDAEARVTFDASASTRLRGLLWKVTGLNRFGIFGDTQSTLDFKTYADDGTGGQTIMQMIRTAGAQRVHFPKALTAISATIGATDQGTDARVEFDASGSSVLRGFFWKVGGAFRFGMFSNAVSTLILRSYTDAGTAMDVAQINRSTHRLEAIRPLGLAAYTTATRPTAADAGANAMILDTTLRKILTSNGTNWADQTGTPV